MRFLDGDKVRLGLQQVGNHPNFLAADFDVSAEQGVAVPGDPRVSPVKFVPLPPPSIRVPTQ